MSQHSENDSDDDDCEYFLQPVSNQYNISEKIKEANQLLYKGESLQRSSQPKVRFRDHQLVDFEPSSGDDGTEIMERRSSSSNNSGSTKREEEEPSSDDGYIDDESVLEVSGDERLIIETIEIEEVTEQIEILEITTSDMISEPNDEPNYEHDEFETEGESAARQASDQNGRPERRRSSASDKASSTKRIFRSKINPAADGDDKKGIRRTTKDCCQYKETDEYKNKLPKYNGLFSHYGLSKDEYVRRESNQFENVQLNMRRQSRRIEQKELLAKTNEDAFAKWLYKKMRNTMSKTNPINMYDVKPSALMRKQRKQEQHNKRNRQTIQRQMETDEYDEDGDGNCDSDEEVYAVDEQEEEDDDDDEDCCEEWERERERQRQEANCESDEQEADAEVTMQQPNNSDEDE